MKNETINFNAKAFRQQLHANPELSGIEINTSAAIVNALKRFGYKKIHTNFSMYSIVVEIDGKNAGPTILFRCEIDALPINEEKVNEYSSNIKNVSHKCGHDGHAAIMLQFAKNLIDSPPQIGKILLFFQSAEEIGAGAKAALDSKFFDQYKIDYAFALHNIPGYKLGNVLVKKGLFTPCVESLVITLQGITSHASEPQKGINPAQAIAEIIAYFENINQYDKSKNDFFIATPIYINLGEKAFGTSAGKASIAYTLRTWENIYFDFMKSEIIKTVANIANKYRLEFENSWVESFCANKNDIQAYEMIKTATQMCKFETEELKNPFEFGEDFGLFTKIYKGAMFGLGAGINQPALHSPNYDFPDELIEIGATIFMNIIKSTNS